MSTDGGKFIVDADGIFHDITKAAFDTFGLTHNGKFDPDFGALMKGSFHDGAKEILKKSGVAGKLLDSWGKGGWMETISGFVSKLAALPATELTAGAVAAAIGGEVGATIGVAIEVGSIAGSAWQYYRKHMASSNVVYGPGQWVAINNGLQPAITHVKDAVSDLLDRRRRMPSALFESNIPDIVVGEDIPMKESLSTGFAVGAGTQSGTIEVFNFMTSRKEVKRTDEVIKLDEDHARKMDNIPVWSEIRLLYFEENVQDRLDSEVNTDPGTEVLFNGERWNVVRAVQKSIFIEHKQTSEQRWVDIGELEPGRRTHNNVWNYGPSGEVAGTFEGSQATLVRGGWVWIAPTVSIKQKYPHVRRQLACIYKLEGKDVCVFAAVDGEYVCIHNEHEELRPVSDELNKFLMQSKELAVFRDAAVRGQDVARLAAGTDRKHTLLTLGITPTNHDTEGRPNWRERGKTVIQKRADRVADRYLDAARRGRSHDQFVDPDSKLVHQVDEANEIRRTIGIPQDDAESVITPYEDDEPVLKSTSNLGMVGVAAAGAAALFFLR